MNKADIIELVMTLKNWIAGGATALCVWFIVHYVKNREKFEDKNDKFKEDVGKKVSEALKDMKDTATKFTEQIDQAKLLSTTMTTKTYEIQEQVMREVSKLQISVTEVNNELKSATSSAGAISQKFKLLYDQVDNIQKVVAAQQHSLGLGAKAFQKLNGDLNNMKTEVLQITEEVKLIRNVNKKH